MVQVTDRDEAVLEWLRVVRMADLKVIRWALSATSGGRRSDPVTLRNGQRWMHRMHQVGLVGTDRPGFPAGSITWPTHDVGLRTPTLFRQTTRHKLLVATVPAGYLAAGYTWKRVPQTEPGHRGRASGGSN